jgi:hypothetical protein
VGILPANARGDGGTVRLSERLGGYDVTVFTSPTPLRAGPVDVSVLVQDAATGQPVPEAEVLIAVAPPARPGEALWYPATRAAAVNKLFQAAQFELPEAGWWQLEVRVAGAGGQAGKSFELEAAAPLPRWAELWFWIAFPVVPVGFFVLHQVLVGRQGRQPRGRTP